MFHIVSLFQYNSQACVENHERYTTSKFDGGLIQNAMGAWIIDCLQLQRAARGHWCRKKLARMRWCLARWTHSSIDRKSFTRSLCVIRRLSVCLLLCLCVSVLYFFLPRVTVLLSHMLGVLQLTTLSSSPDEEWPALVVTSRLDIAGHRWTDRSSGALTHLAGGQHYHARDRPPIRCTAWMLPISRATVAPNWRLNLSPAENSHAKNTQHLLQPATQNDAYPVRDYYIWCNLIYRLLCRFQSSRWLINHKAWRVDYIVYNVM